MSKVLGFGIVLGSFLVKLPQILKIIKAKNGFGISLLSVTLDLTAITICASYNYVKEFPFSAWGDNAVLSIQTAIIAFLILLFNGKGLKAFVYLVTYFGLSYVLMSGITSVIMLWSLQILNIPLLLIGKLSQAYINYQNGSTGQLSAITVFLMFFGSLARIFTSVQETGDVFVIMTYLASSFVNTVITLQMIYYWNCTRIPVLKED